MGHTKSKQKHQYWTNKEIYLLKNLYPQIRLEKLAKFFPKRSKGTIAAKALDLGIPSAKLWQAEENSILRKHFVNASEEELLKLLPKRSWTAIMAQGERLKLKRNRQKPRIKVDEAYFQKWSFRMAYILGFIIADGCIIKGTYKGYSDSLKFGVQKSDIDILEKIKKEFSSEHKISLYKNAAHLSIASQKIADDLKNLGILYRKSLRETIPNIPSKYLKDLLRGIFDGDGSISLNKKGYPSLSLCGSKKVITFISNYFLLNFGIHSEVGKRTRSKNGKYYLFSISYRGNPAQTLIEYLYQNADLYLNRKFLLAEHCMGLQINHRKDYSQEEDKLLTNLYTISPKDNTLSSLTNRSWSSIQQRARVLGIYKYSKTK